MRSSSYILTSRVVARLRERVRPTLEWQAAKEELARLLPFGSEMERPPAWLADNTGQNAPRYVMLGDDVVVVLRVTPAGRRPGSP
jgi:hypothetical protein